MRWKTDTGLQDFADMEMSKKSRAPIPHEMRKTHIAPKGKFYGTKTIFPYAPGSRIAL
jgi:hypothetical protein